LWSLPTNSRVIIDATFSTYIEPDVIEIFQDFRDTFAKENDIEVIITGLKERYEDHPEHVPISKSIEVRNEPNTPQEVLESFIEGNQRYVDGNLVSRRLRNKELTDFIKDAPLAAVINCIDMREPLNMLLNTQIGDLIPL